MFKDQIEAGASLLDKKIPEWLDEIDLEELDVSNCCDCVVGQVFHGRYYTDALKDLLEIPNDEVLNLSNQYGFSVHPDSCGNYDQLTEEWRAYIQDRRDKQDQMSTIE